MDVREQLKEFGTLATMVFSGIAVAVLTAIYSDVRELSAQMPVMVERSQSQDRTLTDHEERLRRIERVTPSNVPPRDTSI